MSDAGNCLFFDWGGTLMRVFDEPGPMAAWSRVQAMPGAVEALSAFSGRFTTALATNAADSDPEDIRAALNRVGLGGYVDHIACFRALGEKKPSREFYLAAARLAGTTPSRSVMVGDEYEADVTGALAAGFRAVWVNPASESETMPEGAVAVPSLFELPAALARLGLA